MKTTIKHSLIVGKVVSTAPAKIWLDLGFDPQDEDEVSFDDLIDVTWSEDNATGYGIQYVRVDITPPQHAWVGLTNAEFRECQVESQLGLFPYAFYLSIEARLKQKNYAKR